VKASQKSLKNWTKEQWGTKSGKPSTQGSKATGERYLPKKARESLSDKSTQRPAQRNVQIPRKESNFPLNQKRLHRRQRGIGHE